MDIKAISKTVEAFSKVTDAVNKGIPKSIAHAAAIIRKSAQESMHLGTGPSRAGTPPNVHQGKLRRSILFSVDENGEAFVGPSYASITAGGRPAWLGAIHEFGKTVQRKSTTRKVPVQKPVRKFVKGQRPLTAAERTERYEKVRRQGHAVNEAKYRVRNAESASDPENERINAEADYERQSNVLETLLNEAAEQGITIMVPQSSRQSARPKTFAGAVMSVAYPARPYMHPALEKNLECFAGSFAGCLGE